jgi:hypothetical protein
MARIEETVDRRKCRRFNILGDAFVVLRPSNTVIGRIIDISEDGLNFECLVGKGQLIQPTELEIILAPEGQRAFHVKHIPCRAIWDLTTWENSLTSEQIRMCGVEFGEMTEDDKIRLMYLIENYSTFNRQKCDARNVNGSKLPRAVQRHTVGYA